MDSNSLPQRRRGDGQNAGQATETWCERNQRNKPQANSAGSGCLILVAGGFHMAMNFGHNIVYRFYVVWFIFAILGSLLSASLVAKVSKKILLFLSSGFLSISGILYLSSNAKGIMILARFLEGLSTGLCFVPIVMLVSEQSVPDMRGLNAGLLDMQCFSLGIFTEMCHFIYSPYMEETFSYNTLCGSTMLSFGIVSFILIQLLLLESPVFLLSNDRESEALESLRRLQLPFTVTQETLDLLEEHKNYIATNRKLSCGQAAIAGLPALIKLSFLYCIRAMSISIFMFSELEESPHRLALSLGYCGPLLLIGLPRWVGSFVGSCLLDPIGRRCPLLIGSAISGTTALAIGVCYGQRSYYYIPFLLATYQFFVGFSMASGSAYLTEAFPLSVKSYYIALVFSTEMIGHISLGALVSQTIERHHLYLYFYILGALSLVLCLTGIIFMPETKKSTLREAQGSFQRCLIRK